MSHLYTEETTGGALLKFSCKSSQKPCCSCIFCSLSAKALWLYMDQLCHSALRTRNLTHVLHISVELHPSSHEPVLILKRGVQRRGGVGGWLHWHGHYGNVCSHQHNESESLLLVKCESWNTWREPHRGMNSSFWGAAALSAASISPSNAALEELLSWQMHLPRPIYIRIVFFPGW